MEVMFILTCKLGNEIINCYDGTHKKEQLKKWASKKILICPICEKPYEYCHGEVNTPYFRHVEKDKCAIKYTESETDEHLTGKRDLFEWIKVQDGVSNAVLEGWIPETKQRPDILFEYNGRKYVIEYQCSPIASEYYDRHDLYRAAGINDIWICGTEKYLGKNKKINTLEENARIYYDVKSKMIYKMENLTKKEMVDIDRMVSFRGNLKSPYKRRKYYNRDFHVMKNTYDYLKGCKNYIQIKSTSNNNCLSRCYYPSGRRSNKYPYPVREYSFSRNYSHATCYKLENIRLSSIDGGK